MCLWKAAVPAPIPAPEGKSIRRKAEMLLVSRGALQIHGHAKAMAVRDRPRMRQIQYRLSRVFRGLCGFQRLSVPLYRYIFRFESTPRRQPQFQQGKLPRPGILQLIVSFDGDVRRRPGFEMDIDILFVDRISGAKRRRAPAGNSGARENNYHRARAKVRRRFQRFDCNGESRTAKASFRHPRQALSTILVEYFKGLSAAFARGCA